MTWILIAWFHYTYGFSDGTTFEKFDTQEACMKAGNDALGKYEGGGDWNRWEYVFVCSPGGVLEGKPHE